MFLWIFKLYRSIRAAFLGKNTTRQLAWGIALGVVLGLVPKGNLLAPTLAVVILCLNINHAFALATAGILTWLGGVIDPISHSIGESILQHPELRQTMTKLQMMPVVPWFDLNNTVVLGSFLLGTALILPVYRLAFPLLNLIRRPKDETPEPTPNPAAPAAALRFDGPSSTVLETHIDVVRLRRAPETSESGRTTKRADSSHQVTSDANDALRYLVRHVRETSEEKAA